MEFRREQGSDGETSVSRCRDRGEKDDGFRDGKFGLGLLGDQWDESAVCACRRFHRTDVLCEIFTLGANVDAPERAGDSEAQCFVDSLKDCVRERC